MGERLKNNNGITTLDLLNPKEIKVANTGELFEYFNYSEVPNYRQPKPSGLISTIDRICSDYGSSMNSSNSDVFINDQINPTFDSVLVGTGGVYSNEWWKEGSLEVEFADLNSVLLGPDWDIDAQYLSLGGSFSSDNSPTVRDRIVVFSPERNYLRHFNKYRTVLLPRKMSTYEFLNLSKRWYEGKLAILIQ